MEPAGRQEWHDDRTIKDDTQQGRSSNPIDIRLSGISKMPTWFKTLGTISPVTTTARAYNINADIGRQQGGYLLMTASTKLIYLSATPLIGPKTTRFSRMARSPAAYLPKISSRRRRTSGVIEHDGRIPFTCCSKFSPAMASNACQFRLLGRPRS